MKVRVEHINSSAQEIWDLIISYITQNKSFESVTGIKYSADATIDLITYKGGSGKRGTEGEDISKDDFIAAYEIIKESDEINTSRIKENIPNSLYRKRSPLIGLLCSAKIIE